MFDQKIPTCSYVVFPFAAIDLHQCGAQALLSKRRGEPGRGAEVIVLVYSLGWRLEREYMHRALLVVTAAALISCAMTPALGACKHPPKPGVDWSNCDKTKLMLRNEDLRQANLTRADISRTDLAGSDLSGALLVEASLMRTRLKGAKLVGADLTKAMFDRANLEAADLSSAIMVKTELHRVRLERANLTGANLEKAELGRASLENANLAGANLARAYLARADLRHAALARADLTEAELHLADFGGVDLSQVRGLKQTQLDESCGDDDTKLPANIVRPAAWPCTTADRD
jgi:uncharacterized protein YjbI with pentapeptide repeats